MDKAGLGVSAMALAFGLGASGAAAQDQPFEIASVDDLVIVGSRSEAAEIGGSVQYIDQETLETFSYGDVNRTLRLAPGVYLQEEEGFGLRPNIGIRGSGTDRNSRITVMEDGVLIAPAPYAAPAAYYFPRIARITGVEVSKGPAAIMYGPMTVGGAINLTSRPIPDDGPHGHFDLFGGEYDGLRAHGSLGGWRQFGGVELGGLIEVLHEASDGFKTIDIGGDTGFEIDDVVVRIGLRTAPGAAMPQSLQLKFQQSDETSDETYLGLTLADFNATPYRRYNGSQVDVMNVDHTLAQLTHRIELSPGASLTTTAYRTDTARAWYKLNDVRNSANTGWVGISAVLEDPVTFADQMDVLIGAPGFTSSISAGGDLRVRNNNREYYAEGVQSVLALEFDTGGVDHDLRLSARYHRDEEDRFQNDDRYHMVDGVMVLVTPGAPGSQDNRIGEAEAWAFFARDTLAWGRWTLSPGVRYETIALTRTNYGTADPGRVGPGTISRRDVDVWIPGLGATYRLNDDWLLLAGAHRGFASPAPGSNIDPETSWNYEAGVRFERGDLHLEAIAFFNDYDNLVGTCTASTGGGCSIGAQFEGGEVEVRGLEVSAGHAFETASGLRIPLSLVYTFTDAEFRSSFSSSFDPWGVVSVGDELPYQPEHQLTLSASVEGARWRANVGVNYVSAARAEAGQGPIPADERVDERVLIDLAGEFRLTDHVALFGTVTNATDEVYNVGFAPAGARPGAPRIAMGGLRVSY